MMTAGVRLALSTLGVAAALLAGAPPAAAADPALPMRATMYDDGLACPGGCDAHVVFAPAHNGTRNAFRPPMSSRDAPATCVRGQACVVCFDDTDGSCLETLYRGGGPPARTFDFTPAFYTAACGKPGLPAVLDTKCRSLAAAVDRLGYRERVDCFATPGDALCRDLPDRAREAKEADAAERAACLREGQAAYNARQANPARRRSLGCNYEAVGTGGPNSAGRTWRKLLPGACRDGTLVGRDGLDCCSGDLIAAAALHPECSPYFPRRPG